MPSLRCLLNRNKDKPRGPDHERGESPFSVYQVGILHSFANGIRKGNGGTPSPSRGWRLHHPFVVQARAGWTNLLGPLSPIKRLLSSPPSFSNDFQEFRVKGQNNVLNYLPYLSATNDDGWIDGRTYIGYTICVRR